MNLISEHRLVRKTIEDIVKNPSTAQQIQYNSRTAAANADVNGGTNWSSDTSGDRFIAAGVNAPDGYQQPANTTDPNSQSILNQAGANVGPGSTVYDPKTGTAVSIPSGEIAQSAYNRLIGSGMTPAEAAAKLNDPSYHEGIQQATNTYGAPTDGAPVQGNSGSAPPIFKGENAPVMSAQYDAAVAAKGAAEAQGQFYTSENQRAGEKQKAASQTNQRDTQTGATDLGQSGGQDPALGQILSMLPPGMEWLGAVLQNSSGTADASLAAAAARREGRGEQIDDSTKSRNSLLKDSMKRSDEMFGIATKVLGDSLDKQDRLLAQREETNQNRLDAQEETAVRNATDDLHDEIDQMNAEIATGGAIGSSNAQDRVRKVRMKGEQTIRDMKKDFGFKRADLSMYYTDKVVEAHKQFVNDWQAAVDKHEAKIDAVELGFIQNEDRKIELYDKADSEFYAAYDKALDRKANTLEKAVQYVSDSMDKERALQAAEAKHQSDMEWDRYKFGQQQAMQGLQIQVQQGAREDAAAARLDQQNLTTQQKIINDITMQTNRDKIITEAREASLRYDTMLSVYNNNDVNGKNFPDQVLINNFNKLTDPASVVRESEYARSADGLSTIQMLTAKLQKIGVGGVLTPAARKELVDTAKTLYDSYQTTLNQRQQPFLLRLQSLNAKLPPEYQVSPEMVGLTTSSTSSQRSNAESLAAPGMFPTPSPRGGGETPPGESAGSDLSEFGRITQGYSTPVATAANGGLYDEHTVKAWGGHHAGIDVAMPEGTRLPSVVSGEVVSMGTEGGWGKTVVIKDAAGALHRYSHLKAFEQGLKKGATISRGQFIAFSGNSGNSTGPHLDYRIKLDGKYLDPFEYASLN